MVLFCTYLYHHLPQFIPRAVVEFKGNLQEKVVKEIELTNSTTAAVSYSVQLEGSTDFALTEHMLHLDPKSTKKFPVTFTSRFSKPAEARLTFTSRRKTGSNQVSVMVFRLKSVVDRQKPLKIFDFELKVYHYQQLAIEVVNPLSISGMACEQLKLLLMTFRKISSIP